MRSEAGGPPDRVRGRPDLVADAGARKASEEKQDHLFVKVDRQYPRVELADILYLESYGNYVKIWTGDSFLLTTRTLSGMMEELPSSDFLKIHKSFVVRKDLVDYLEGNQLVMKNEQVLPVGKLQREAVRDWVRG